VSVYLCTEIFGTHTHTYTHTHTHTHTHTGATQHSAPVVVSGRKRVFWGVCGANSPLFVTPDSHVCSWAAELDAVVLAQGGGEISRDFYPGVREAEILKSTLDSIQ